MRGGTAFKHNPEQLHGSPLALKTQPIERLDLCGCVSRTFIEALAELREKYNLNANTSTHTDAQEKNNVTDPSTIFPHVKRLGLFNMILSQSLFIDFAMSFPNLTHLDLGNTRTNGQLLHLIGQSSTIRLKSLSLAKCTMLNSQSIRDFFLLSNSNVLQDLEELNLYYEGTLSIPLIKEHLKDILEYSIPFNSGKLKYLDLSTSPLDDELLENYFAKQQPHLLDLGLANCPNITWKGLSKFLEEKAFNVEVLDIRGSCRQILFPTSPTQGRVARRNDVLLNTIVGVHQYLVKLPITSTTKTSSTSTSSSSSSNKTKLRVIELDEKVLEAIDEANANPNWKVFFGKSYRGWYVNCTIHIDPITNERIHEQMDKSDKRSKNLFDLAGKSKSGGLNFGWHSRKMSVLGDDGMRK